MARVTAFIRVSTTKKREEIKAKVLIDPVDRAEFNRNVNNLNHGSL